MAVDAHRQALRGLARLNTASRASHSLWCGVQRLIGSPRPERPLRVLDVASGGGDIACGLANKAHRAGIPLSIEGIDFSATAVDFARERVHPTQNVSFRVADVLTGDLPAGFDLITCSLFLHHLTEAQSVSLLQRMTRAAKLGVVVSDLRRSTASYALAVAACRLSSRSPVVAVDGPRSVEGAYTIEEFRSLTEQARITDVTLRPAWPQRFLATWRSTDA